MNTQQTVTTEIIGGTYYEHQQHAVAQQNLQVLTFILGQETYGLDILRVQEIRGWETTTKLPETPEYVKGVINMRGAVVPIVDLRDRFGIGGATYDDSTVVIITRLLNSDTAKTIGLVVDGVSDVEDIDVSQLQAVPSFSGGGKINEQYIQGLANLKDSDASVNKMVIVLNVDALILQGIFNEMGESTV
jgi:purine-binding chemotaxis protein CheW